MPFHHRHYTYFSKNLSNRFYCFRYLLSKGKKMSDTTVVVGAAYADKVQLKLGTSQTLLSLTTLRFTRLGEQTLFEMPIIGFVPKKDLGSVRIATEVETLALAGKAKFYYNEQLLSYLHNIPPVKLSEISLTFIFLQYRPSVRIASHLNDMLWLSQRIKKESQSGKLDYETLEKRFAGLLGDKPISQYIPQARKHSYLKVLGGAR